MIVDLGHGIADERDGRVLRGVLVDLGDVAGAPEARRLVVHVDEDDGDLGGYRRRRHEFGQLPDRDLEDERAVAVVRCLPVQLGRREDRARGGVDVEEVARAPGYAVRHAVVDALVAVDRSDCGVRGASLVTVFLQEEGLIFCLA